MKGVLAFSFKRNVNFSKKLGVHWKNFRTKSAYPKDSNNRTETSSSEQAIQSKMFACLCFVVYHRKRLESGQKYCPKYLKTAMSGICIVNIFVRNIQLRPPPPPPPPARLIREIFTMGFMLTLLVCHQVKCHHYWPSEGSRLYGVILVELVEEASFGDYISRKFKLTHTEVCVILS